MVKSRYTSKQKAEIVLELLNTKTSTAELCRRHNIHPQTLNRWKEEFLKAGKTAFDGRSIEAAYRNVQRETVP